MKNIWKYVISSIIVAIGGMIVAAYAGNFFNALGGYGFGCILGICIYLCVVIVICTGIIIEQINKNTK